MKQMVLLFGQPVEQMPRDLYIPPDALQILLEGFEGPLDLLLYLIQKQNIDILNIPISLITEQYLSYLEMMEKLDMSLAAEYLLMAATLAEIKARMLLPRPPSLLAEDEREEDPRSQLAEQLLTYLQTRQAAEQLENLPRVEAGTALSSHLPPASATPICKPSAEPQKLAQALLRLWRQQDLRRAHEVEEEHFSLAERVELFQHRLKTSRDWQDLRSFCPAEEGRAGVVISLMAMLELDRSQWLEWQQECYFSPITVRPRAEIDLQL